MKYLKQMFLLLAATTLMGTIEVHRQAEEHLNRQKENHNIVILKAKKVKEIENVINVKKNQKTKKAMRKIGSRILAVIRKMERFHKFLGEGKQELLVL